MIWDKFMWLWYDRLLGKKYNQVKRRCSIKDSFFRATLISEIGKYSNKK